jgi:steroid delta-isomerase-like uncharacterized protein
MSDAKKQFVRLWFEEVWNKGRADAIDELAAVNTVVHGLGDVMRGPEGFKPFHSAFRDAFPDIQVTVDDVICEGDMVAARWTAKGTHRGAGLGFGATGRTMQVTGMTFARIDADGRLCEGWNSFDRLGMLQQLGVVPATP